MSEADSKSWQQEESEFEVASAHTSYSGEPGMDYGAGLKTVLTDDDVDDFIAALRRSKQELDIARQQFENVVDPRLIDHVVFRLGAAERHFSYLLQLARQWNISVDGMRWDWNEDSHD